VLEVRQSARLTCSWGRRKASDSINIGALGKTRCTYGVHDQRDCWDISYSTVWNQLHISQPTLSILMLGRSLYRP
jgi:hypothetical protein